METNEDLDNIQFEHYREMCADQPYRKTGIMDEDSYSRAVGDDRTVFAVSDPSVPLVSPIEYVDGYDVDRIKRLLDSDDVRYLALPLSRLEESDVTAFLSVVGPQTKIVIEDCPESFDKEKQEGIEINNVWGDSEDPAWVGIYAATVDLNKEPEARKVDNSCRVYSGKEVSKDLVTSDDIWDLFKDKFSWLGENHPLSMEDTKEFFESIIHDPETFTAVKVSDEGEMLAAGIFMHGLNSCNWLDIDNLEEIKPSPDQTSLYFFGIAAKNNNDTVKHAEDLIKFQCKWESELGNDLLLIFESSEISSKYIPDIVEKYINDSGFYRISRPKLIEKKTYSYIQARI